MYVDSGDMDDMEYYVELRELDAETSKCYIIARRTTMRGAGQPCSDLRHDETVIKNKYIGQTLRHTW